MAMLPDVFKSDEHEPMQDFTPIPDAWYMFEIVKSEVVPTKDKKGKRLNFQMKVVDGGEIENDEPKHKGRIVFDGLNIDNRSSQAVKISMGELRSICDACEVEMIEDSVELHDIPFWGKVSTETSEGYPPKNVIKKYTSIKEYEDA